MNDYKSKCLETIKKLNNEILSEVPITVAEKRSIMSKLDDEVELQKDRIHPRTPYQIFSEIVKEKRSDYLTQEYVLRTATRL